jgi:hypothetical protein
VRNRRGLAVQNNSFTTRLLQTVFQIAAVWMKKAYNMSMSSEGKEMCWQKRKALTI